MEEAALSQSDKIISVTAGCVDAMEEGVRVHSNGLVAPWKATEFNASIMATVKDPAGPRPTGWNWLNVRYLDDLPTPRFMGKDTVQRALAKIGQRKIHSGKFDMLVENRVANRMVGMLTYPMTGEVIQQKRSFLESMKGKQIATDKLTLVDDPQLEKGMASRHFDPEGLAGITRTMIEKGVLKEFFISNYYSRKLNVEPTSGSTSNLTFAPGQRSLDELIKSIDRGILVRDFIGGNSNSITGDFSYGIIGDLIEKGKTVKPVYEMNISGNARDFWIHLAEVGNDPYKYSAWQTPSMLFKDVAFSGV